MLCVLPILVNVAPAWGQSVSEPPAIAPIVSPIKRNGNEGAETIEVLQPNQTQTIVADFLRKSSAYKEHQFNQLSAVFEDSNNQPGLQLRKIWVSDAGTLVEMVGLTRRNKPNSAVIRKGTFQIRDSEDQIKRLIRFEGVTELVDRKGGSALVVKPGDVFFAWFETVDDYRPFSISHLALDNSTFVYFENIDPRFRERYEAYFLAANQNSSSPEQMKDFIVNFARNDPDKKVPSVFLKLIQRMRAEKTFEGYYNAYLLMQSAEDAKSAYNLMRTDEHRAMMEHLAVTTLQDKSRLLALDLRLDSTSTKTSEGSCWIGCHYNFTAYRPIAGSVTVKANIPNSPIKLKLGTYKINLFATASISRQKQVRSQTIWVSNFDGAENQVVNREISVTLSPPNYSATVPLEFDPLTIAFFDRGSAGGYTAIWATDNASTSVSFKSLELIK